MRTRRRTTTARRTVTPVDPAADAVREFATRQARSLLGHDPTTPLEDDTAVAVLAALLVAADYAPDGLCAVPGWVLSRSSDPCRILLQGDHGDLAAILELSHHDRACDSWCEIALALVAFGAPHDPYE